jgi:hypothetical protein
MDNIIIMIFEHNLEKIDIIGRQQPELQIIKIYFLLETLEIITI